MKYTSKQYAGALWEVWKKKSPVQRTAVLDNFIKLLKKQKAMKKLDFIKQELEKIYLVRNGLLKAEIISPYPLSKTSLNKLKKFISSFFRHKTNSIILEQRIDKDLIGGFQIKAKGFLIEAALKNILNKLNQRLRT